MLLFFFDMRLCCVKIEELEAKVVQTARDGEEAKQQALADQSESLAAAALQDKYGRECMHGCTYTCNHNNLRWN